MKQTNKSRNRGLPSSLDRIDFGILDALQKNARLSNKELAAEVGLAPSSCLQRVRRLTDAGILRGFHAEVDPGSLGIGLQALTALRLRDHARDQFSNFREHVRSLPEVVAIYQVSGATDFLIHVCVRDVAHLRELVVEKLAGRPEVGHLETSIIFDFMRCPGLPRYRA